jgi:hypothetical protein
MIHGGSGSSGSGADACGRKLELPSVLVGGGCDPCCLVVGDKAVAVLMFETGFCDVVSGT